MTYTRIFVLLAAIFLVAADNPVAPTLQSVTVQPADFGADWRWPWDTPREQTFAAAETNQPVARITAEQWKAQFWTSEDPRPMLRMQAREMQNISDEDFRAVFAMFGAMMGYLSQSGGVIGAEITAGGSITQVFSQTQITRTQFVAEIRAQVDSITDFAYTECNRSKPNGKTSAIKGYVPTDDDSATFKYLAYTADYCQTRKMIFDLSPDALQQAVKAMEQTREQVKKAKEDAGVEIAKQCDRLQERANDQQKRLTEAKQQNYPAETLDAMQKTLDLYRKEQTDCEKQLNDIATYQAEAHGAILQNVDGGYITWQTDVDASSRNIVITGKLRRGSVVVEFGRVANGQYVDTAVEDTKRILNIVAKKLDPYLLPTSPRGDIGVNADKTIDRTYRLDIKPRRAAP